jgi:hypothetical protein
MIVIRHVKCLHVGYGSFGVLIIFMVDRDQWRDIPQQKHLTNILLRQGVSMITSSSHVLYSCPDKL